MSLHLIGSPQIWDPQVLLLMFSRDILHFAGSGNGYQFRAKYAASKNNGLWWGGGKNSNLENSFMVIFRKCIYKKKKILIPQPEKILPQKCLLKKLKFLEYLSGLKDLGREAHSLTS